MSLSAIRRIMLDIMADERGFTALEYSLITVIVGSAIIGCVGTLGTSLSTSYTHLGAVLMELASSVN